MVIIVYPTSNKWVYVVTFKRVQHVLLKELSLSLFRRCLDLSLRTTTDGKGRCQISPEPEFHI